MNHIQLRGNAEKLAINLAPLVGCKSKEKEWSPRTALYVCKNIRIASLICIDVESETYRLGPLKYTFSNRISIRASTIHKLALSYSPVVLNPTYVLEAQRIRNNKADLKHLLFMQSINHKYNDSSIIDILDADQGLRLCPVYRHILLVLLETFALRFGLCEYAFDGMPLVQSDMTKRRLEQLVENIEFVRVKLEEWDADRTYALNHHLSNLLMNVLAVHYDVTKYYLEV